jgi:hypothetical protein
LILLDRASRLRRGRQRPFGLTHWFGSTRHLASDLSLPENETPGSVSRARDRHAELLAHLI